MRKNICVDIDGCLADFEGYFCKQFGFDNRELLKLENRYPDMAEGISLFISSSQTYTNLNVVPLGLQIIRYIDSLKSYDICLVSSRPEYCLTITNTWLKKNQIPYMTLSVGHDKVKRIMKLNPVFAIDDMGEIAQDLKKVGINTILISQPWNRKFEGLFPRISDFQMFLWQFDRILEGAK